METKILEDNGSKLNANGFIFAFNIYWGKVYDRLEKTITNEEDYFDVNLQRLSINNGNLLIDITTDNFFQSYWDIILFIDNIKHYLPEDNKINTLIVNSFCLILDNKEIIDSNYILNELCLDKDNDDDENIFFDVIREFHEKHSIILPNLEKLKYDELYPLPIKS